MNDNKNANQSTLAWPLLAATLAALLVVVTTLIANSSQRAAASTQGAQGAHRTSLITEHSSAGLHQSAPSAPSAGPLVDPCGPNSNYTYTVTLNVTPEPVTNLVSGSQCDECTVAVGLPFPVQLYDGIFS